MLDTLIRPARRQRQQESGHKRDRPCSMTEASAWRMCCTLPIGAVGAGRRDGLLVTLVTWWVPPWPPCPSSSSSRSSWSSPLEFSSPAHHIPRVWNSLPVQLCNLNTIYGLFRWQLKGHLFQEAWTQRSVTSDIRRHRKPLTYLLTYSDSQIVVSQWVCRV